MHKPVPARFGEIAANPFADHSGLGTDLAKAAAESLAGAAGGVEALAAHAGGFLSSSLSAATRSLDAAVGAGSIWEATQAQAAIARDAYAASVAAGSRLTELWAETMRQTLAPFEAARRRP